MSTAQPSLTARPDTHFGHATAGKVGMWVFLVSDAFSFGGLLLAYAYLRARSEVWRGADEPALGIGFTAVLTFLLICSSLTMVMAVQARERQEEKKAARFLFLTALGGALFLLGQAHEYFGVLHGFGLGHGLIAEGLRFGHSHYATTFFVATSFHGLHVFAGTLYLLITALRTLWGRASSNEVEVAGLFWHFVDLVWILVFTFVYLV